MTKDLLKELRKPESEEQVKIIPDECDQRHSGVTKLSRLTIK